ncbi:acyltransferase family protein [Neolewinella sp.]|uniref:acyltransferase family protein n=1 Tax=Neolewinella sp. TaxID=2993543 RepID=UPI003B528B9C
MKYRPELDGLRAVAVVPVILFHAGFSLFGGGFVGVDIFFVLSGYLITGILCRQLDAGTFSLITFYEKRARRILPALFTVMAVTLPFAWAWLMPSDMMDYAQSLVAVSTYASNILFWLEAGYWDTSSELKPLLHTWTLAVEEQYYVLFPLFLMLMWRRIGRQWAFPLLLVSATLSLILAQWGTTRFPDAAFYLLPTRGWELAIGASISFLSTQQPGLAAALVSNRRRNELLSSLGLAAILYSVFCFDEANPFPGLYALVPTLGAAGIIVFASPLTWVGRLLSLRPAVTIGLISYSAYLWHQPLFAFTRQHSLEEPTPLLMLGLSALVLPLSYLSWKYVENPFRDKGRYGRRTIFTLAAVGSLFFAGLGVAGHLTRGFPQRDAVRVLQVRNYQPDNSILRQQSWVNLQGRMKTAAYQIEKNASDNALWFQPEQDRLKVLVIGNSHSKDVYNTLLASATAEQHFQLARYGVQVSALAQSDHSFYESPNYRQADVIMVASRYSIQDLARLEQVTRRLVCDQKLLVLVQETFQFPTLGNKTMADQMLQKFLINQDEPSINGNGIERLVTHVNQAYFEEYATHQQQIERSHRELQRVADRYRDANVLTLNRMDYICNTPAGECYAIDVELDKYLYDSGHHTVQGAAFFGARIDSIDWLGSLISALGSRSAAQYRDVCL